MIASEQRDTIAEFEAQLAAEPDALLELIDGRIVAKVTGQRHGKLAGWILHLLITHLQAHPEIEGHWGTEVHHRLPADHPDAPNQVRQPDVSFIYSDADATDETVNRMPDFAVEIKSPSNSYDSLRAKAKFYIAHGTRLVWLVYPARSIVEVYFADGSSELYLEDDTLSGGEVLPGFDVPVRDIFAI